MSGIQLLASLLIVAASPAAPIDTASFDGGLPDAVTVLECGFEPDRDLGDDDLPPGWSRQRGPGYPAWLPAALCREPTPHGQGCLRLAVNGGRVVVHSPPLEASTAAKFAAQVEVRTHDLNHDSALLSLSFLDAEGKTLETVTSEGTSAAREWTRLRVAPVAPRHAATRFVRISLHLEPRDPTRLPDFHGEALFDQAWLGRLPRVSLEVSATGHLATTGDDVSFTCVVSTWPGVPPQPELTVADAYGQPLPEMLHRFTLVSQPDAMPIEPGRRECHWQAKLERPGFYRVRAEARGPSGALHFAEVPLAVVDPREATEYNEFGWTLADGERDIPLAQLPRLLRLGGVGRLKFPAWLAADDHARLDELTRFADALRRNGVSIVGLLSLPPADVGAKLPTDVPALAARTFQLSPDVWYPSVAQMQARLGLDIRAWQLGDDRDTSFVGFPNLSEKLTEIRRELNRLGQDVTLGVAWKWSEPVPSTSVTATSVLGLPVLPSPLQFVSMTAQPPLTTDELFEKLAAARGAQPARWATLTPLDRETTPLDARVSDIVGRMIAAKVQGAAAVFVSDPLDPRHGLVRPDGVPEELFVPWRTTAAMMAGAERLGSLTLPNSSRNEVFAHKGRIAMVVWSDRPQREVLELGPGENVQQTDVWGLSKSLTHAAAGHSIDVGRLPSFITGAHEPLTRMRLAVSIASPRMPSRFGVRQQNAIYVKNTFPCGIAGSVRIVPPEGWRARPDTIELQLPEGGAATLPLELNVPLSGETGKSKLRLDFELTADRRYTFSAWQNIEVGEPDLHLDVSANRTAAGTIEVVQRLVNETAGPVSFRCFLYVPGQRRQRHEVLHLAPGTDTFVFHVDGGEALRGQTLWLRAEEIAGQRVLSHRFEVE